MCNNNPSENAAIDKAHKLGCIEVNIVLYTSINLQFFKNPLTRHCNLGLNFTSSI